MVLMSPPAGGVFTFEFIHLQSKAGIASLPIVPLCVHTAHPARMPFRSALAIGRYTLQSGLIKQGILYRLDCGLGGYCSVSRSFRVTI